MIKLLIFSIFGIVFYKSCELTPATKRDLDGKIVMMQDARFNDGVIASTIASAVKHRFSSEQTERDCRINLEGCQN